MKAFWIGSSGNPVNNATRYQYITAVPQSTWSATETDKAIPMSDALTVTKLTVWVQTAPGAGKNFAFTLRNNIADTAATLTISDANLTASWSGSLSVSQLNRLAIKAVPTGTPTLPARVWWVIEYETSGNFFLWPGGGQAYQDFEAAQPLGGTDGIIGNHVAAGLVVPAPLTVTKIAAMSDGNSTNTFVVRKNDSSDSAFSAVNGTGNVAVVSSTGSFTFAAGDVMSIKRTDAGADWAAHFYCVTIVPDTAGYHVLAMRSITGSPSTSFTEYEAPQGAGDNDWDSTETNVYMRLPACTLTSMYVKLVTAPGSGNSRTFTVRSNVADTALAVTIADAATTGTDGDSVSHGDGNFVSIRSDPVSGPASSNVTISFVAFIPQAAANMGAFFALF